MDRLLEIEAKLNDTIRAENIKYAIKHEPQYSLKKLLEFKTVEELKFLCRITFIKGYSKLKKEQLIEEVYKKLIDIKVIKSLILVLTDDDWSIFRHLVDKKINKNEMFLGKECTHLIAAGLLWIFYYNDDLYYVVPTEHRRNFIRLVEEGVVELKDVMCSINAIAKAATNLYGIIEMNEFVELLNRYNESDFTIDTVVTILEHYKNYDVNYSIIDGYLASDEFEGDANEVHALAEIVKSKPRYIPSFEEFILYEDEDYNDAIDQLDALYEYLVDNKICEDGDFTEELVGYIAYLCRMEYKIKDCLEVLEEENIVFDSDQQFEDISALIINIMNNSRIWSNKGYTPKEMYNILYAPSSKPKIGRNAPCPCGSGKKYKKCCGR